MLLAALLELGVPYEYLEKMAKETPAKVLGLDPDWRPSPAPTPSPTPSPTSTPGS